MSVTKSGRSGRSRKVGSRRALDSSRKQKKAVPAPGRVARTGKQPAKGAFGNVNEAAPSGTFPNADLADLCPDAIVVTDVDGIIQLWNPAASRLLQYTDDEIMGRSLIDLIPKRHRAAFRRSARRFRRDSSATLALRTLRSEALRKDGHELPVELSVRVAESAGRRWMIASIRDSSDSVLDAERLNQAVQRLRLHLERTPLGVVDFDRQFRIVEWNQSAQRIFQWSREEILGRNALILVPPAARVHVDRVWADLLAGDTASHSINENLRKDRSTITCEWFNTPLMDGHRQVYGVASIVQDVTSREQLETQLRHTQKLESLGVLASGVAHDFNNLLMVILGNVDLLKKMERLSPRSLEQLALIELAGTKANHLVNQLLTYARTGRHRPVRTRLNDVVEGALTVIRSAMPPDVTLDVRLADKLPDIVADSSQIEQVLLNLSLNAFAAMPQGGRVTIRTRRGRLTQDRIPRCIPSEGARPGNWVELVVEDQGIGMDAKTVQRIFDPFFTTKAGGHGLGLAAVLGILRQHGAHAIVDSTVGKGTVFHVLLRPATGKAV